MQRSIKCLTNDEGSKSYSVQYRSRVISEQFQCSFAVSPVPNISVPIMSSFRAISEQLRDNFMIISGHLQHVSTLRAVPGQLESSLRAVSEQFLNKFKAAIS